jgi:DNA-binding beta-propeller fold protein YncE
LLALLCGACSDEKAAPESISPAARESRGADHLLLRVPRAGGTGRVYLYPNLDSTVSVVDEVPRLARILAFDAQEGTIAFVDQKGLPGRINLRETDVRTATRIKLTSLSSANGTDIFGVTAKGEVTRLNPVGADWKFEPPVPARGVFAQPNGDLIVAANKGAQTILWKLRPPDDLVDDSTVLPLSGRGVSTQVGDRVYFTVDSGLVGVKARDLSPVGAVKFGSPVRALAPTPSGDRLYVATTAEKEIAVVDRYTERVKTRIPLPAAPTELRMDALGRYLLARFPDADSAWVIAIGTNRLVGVIPTKWEADLPALTPEGNLALLGDRDVTFVDPETLEVKRTVAGGAKDFWYFFSWDGFRPRAQGIDDPVTFANDSTFVDTLTPGSTPSAVDTAARPAGPAVDSASRPPRASPAEYSVSFAALLSEEKARDLAAAITINGTHAHVVATNTAGSPIFRVVMGPYATREEADKIGRASRRDYWVYEGTP